jgi:hypothetical protein
LNHIGNFYSPVNNEIIEKIINKIDYFKNKKNNNKLIFENGIFSDKDYLSPSYINISNPKYFEIDNNYYSTLIIINYFREQQDLILKSIIDTNIDLNISIFYEKQDTYKTITELSEGIYTEKRSKFIALNLLKG